MDAEEEGVGLGADEIGGGKGECAELFGELGVAGCECGVVLGEAGVEGFEGSPEIGLGWAVHGFG